MRDLPRIDPKRSIQVAVPASNQWADVHAVLPATLGAKPGRAVELVVFADHGVQVEAIALVPLADELPPPPPEPWQPKTSPSAP